LEKVPTEPVGKRAYIGRLPVLYQEENNTTKKGENPRNHRFIEPPKLKKNKITLLSPEKPYCPRHLLRRAASNTSFLRKAFQKK